MRSVVLNELVSLVAKSLTNMTNQAYSRNNKFSYKVEWVKGDKEIEVETLGKTSKYYIICLYLINKNESPVGKRINLYTCYYPIEGLVTSEKLEEMAYKELISNGIISLTNNVYASYMHRITQDIVKPEDVNLDVEALKEDAKPKMIITQ